MRMRWMKMKRRNLALLLLTLLLLLGLTACGGSADSSSGSYAVTNGEPYESKAAAYGGAYAPEAPA